VNVNDRIEAAQVFDAMCGECIENGMLPLILIAGAAERGNGPTLMVLNHPHFFMDPEEFRRFMHDATEACIEQGTVRPPPDGWKPRC